MGIKDWSPNTSACLNTQQTSCHHSLLSPVSVTLSNCCFLTPATPPPACVFLHRVFCEFIILFPSCRFLSPDLHLFHLQAATAPRVPSAGRAAYSPAVLLSQWLNIKHWQTPILPPPFLAFLSRPPLVSSLLPFPLPFPTAPPHPLLLFPSLLCLAPSLLRFALHPHLHYLWVFPEGPTTWSPWWLQDRPITVSCCVKVKVFLCLSKANLSIYSSLQNNQMCAQKCLLFYFFLSFSLLTLLCFFKAGTFLRSTYKKPLLIGIAAA